MTLERRTPLRRTGIRPGKPLERRTALRTNVALRRGAPLRPGSSTLRRSQLAPMSDKRRDEAPERAEVRRQATARDRGCVAKDLVPEVKCWGPLDADEIAPRGVRPGGHLDVDNVQMICRGHHEWKTANPKEAHARGLRRWSWEDR